MILIGDVHGKREEYLKLVAQHESSIQVGDMDFNYDHLNGVDPSKHWFIGGNHDNWDRIGDCRNFLGRYGYAYNDKLRSFFYVSGAYSIDKCFRRENVSWWRREELDCAESKHCLDAYTRKGLDIVISHDCPQSVAEAMFDMRDCSWTRKLLEEMLRAIRPKLWVFGHHHKSRKMEINGTQFVCLAELETMEIG